jgi:transcriptional regulator with XRE-family HTH domain
VNDVKKRIRAGLKRKKHTQQWLAGQLGISKSHMSQILSGQRRPSLTLALRLEELTGVPVRDFAEVA